MFGRFTFLRTGGTVERVQIKLISNPSSDQAAARRLLVERFTQFKAENASCFLDRDRQRLLAVIETGFGDFVKFNSIVRNVFAATVVEAARGVETAPSEETLGGTSKFTPSVVP